MDRYWSRHASTDLRARIVDESGRNHRLRPRAMLLLFHAAPLSGLE